MVTHLDDGNLAAMLRSTARPEALPLKRACWAKRVRSEAKGKQNAVAKGKQNAVANVAKGKENAVANQRETKCRGERRRAASMLNDV